MKFKSEEVQIQFEGCLNFFGSATAAGTTTMATTTATATATTTATTTARATAAAIQAMPVFVCASKKILDS